MKNNEGMNKGLEKHEIINSKRQPKNHKPLLSASKFDQIEKNYCVTKCNNPRCRTCKIIIKCKTYIFKIGLKYQVKANLNWNQNFKLHE